MGVIAALLLNLCAVFGRNIIADYVLTYDLMRPLCGNSNGRYSDVNISSKTITADG
jgi:hypothetical protein